MFGKGGFEGNFRTTPNQSIRGASKSESKEELLRRAQEERKAREAKRLKNGAATKVQALVRGHLARCRHKRQARKEFGELQKRIQSDKNPPELARVRLACVLVLHGGEGGAWCCGLLVKHRDLLLPAISEDSGWCFLMCRMLGHATHILSTMDSNATLAPPLRLLEEFTRESNYPNNGNKVVARMYRHLFTKEKYFKQVRRLIETRIPPLLETTTRPPTALAGELLNMVARPLEAVQQLQDRSLTAEMMHQLCQEFLSPDPSDQVHLFLLPSLASLHLLRLDPLVQCLLDEGRVVARTPCLFYSFLLLSQEGILGIASGREEAFFAALALLSQVIPAPLDDAGDDSDDEDEDDVVMEDAETAGEAALIKASIGLLNDRDFVGNLVVLVERVGGRDKGSKGPLPESTAQTVRHLCYVCHRLLMHSPTAMHNYALLFTLAFRQWFLHTLWNVVTSSVQTSILSSHPTPLIQVLSRGIKMSNEERDKIAPSLATFASLFSHLLVTIHDTEFYQRQSSGQVQTRWMPFTLGQLVPMALALRDVALGLVELAFPESRPSVRGRYIEAVGGGPAVPDEGEEAGVAIWSHLFKAVVALVRQLHSRDNRRQFCPREHWIQPRLALPLDRPEGVSFHRSRIRAYRPFRGLRVFTREELESSGPPLSTREVRLATVLRELPFTISFEQRVSVFQSLIQREKQEQQGDRVNFLQGPSIDLHVRRNYIYEDAFDKLSPDNEANLRLKMRVQLVNAAGLDEAGIDGGGLFREFLSQLLKAAFDPNRGFFTLTRDQMLYPSPSAAHIHPDAAAHYYFIGRMLGKAMYENLLVELPLAPFFLSKILGQTLDIDHLDSLDPELYRNLLSLKTFEGDVQDNFGIDFTVVVEEFGQTRIELLKPEGDSIPVTSENRIEYIHLVADYKLNRQIKAQCSAFRNGLADVIGLDWLRMFSSRELSILISGSEQDIGMDDLMAHTNYSGGYEAAHPTIQAFWAVVTGLEEVTLKAFTLVLPSPTFQAQKKKLLKFVTSCSRPPLLGFKDLDPPFCIQNAGTEQERIPTASTCMNLLKLPDYKDRVLLKRKLIQAIESEAGFELS